MKILLVSQVFHPDVVAIGQHLTDLADALSRNGHEVTVLSGRSRYDQPEQQFAPRELRGSIKIRRIWNSRWGKGSLLRRMLTAAVFFGGLLLALVRQRRPDVVLTTTAPPFLPCLVAAYARIRGVRFVYWCSDLNPDEAFALGVLRPNSIVGRILARLSVASLRTAERIVVMDDAMAARLAAKQVPESRIWVVAPWAHSDQVRWISRPDNPFFSEFTTENRFLVMYAGNHSPCHSLQTLLDAAYALRDRSDILFCFSGGGSGKVHVLDFKNQNGLKNILILPYQPMAALAGLLSAADLHVVSLGNEFVGIVHPCKIYNMLAIGAPVLFFGPSASPLAALLDDRRALGHVVAHGDVAGAVAAISAAAAAGRRRSRGSEILAERFDPNVLVAQMVALITESSPKLSSWGQRALRRAAS